MYPGTKTGKYRTKAKKEKGRSGCSLRLEASQAIFSLPVSVVDTVMVVALTVENVNSSEVFNNAYTTMFLLTGLYPRVISSS